MQTAEQGAASNGVQHNSVSVERFLVEALMRSFEHKVVSPEDYFALHHPMEFLELWASIPETSRKLVADARMMDPDIMDEVDNTTVVSALKAGIKKGKGKPHDFLQAIPPESYVGSFDKPQLWQLIHAGIQRIHGSPDRNVADMAVRSFTQLTVTNELVTHADFVRMLTAQAIWNYIGEKEGPSVFREILQGIEKDQPYSPEFLLHSSRLRVLLEAVPGPVLWNRVVGPAALKHKLYADGTSLTEIQIPETTDAPVRGMTEGYRDPKARAAS